jgi:hypothetical protein
VGFQNLAIVMLKANAQSAHSIDMIRANLHDDKLEIALGFRVIRCLTWRIFLTRHRMGLDLVELLSCGITVLWNYCMMELLSCGISVLWVDNQECRINLVPI